MTKKVLVAMSGGVDSSVTAVILKEQGYDIYGATMKLFANQDIGIDRERTCCSLKDVEDARSVSQKLGFPYYVFNFTEDFQKEVIEAFAASYLKGETPNPCLNCNRFLKFKLFLNRALFLEMDYIATGHYARIAYNSKSKRYELKKAVDPTKDQSYVLYTLTQEELSKTLFPLGDLPKTDVRDIAAKTGLKNAAKPDSQDICFVPDGDYAGFLERMTGTPFVHGNILDIKGNVLGLHKGIVHYTIGQRRGIGIAFPEPLYVIYKDALNNTITVGTKEALYQESFITTDINLISIASLDKPLQVNVKTRYKQIESAATISPLTNGDILVKFKEPQAAITPGQAAVFYLGDTVVGGGTIV